MAGLVMLALNPPPAPRVGAMEVIAMTHKTVRPTRVWVRQQFQGGIPVYYCLEVIEAYIPTEPPDDGEDGSHKAPTLSFRVPPGCVPRPPDDGLKWCYVNPKAPPPQHQPPAKASPPKSCKTQHPPQGLQHSGASCPTSTPAAAAAADEEQAAAAAAEIYNDLSAEAAYATHPGASAYNNPWASMLSADDPWASADPSAGAAHATHPTASAENPWASMLSADDPCADNPSAGAPPKASADNPWASMLSADDQSAGAGDNPWARWVGTTWGSSKASQGDGSS